MAVGEVEQYIATDSVAVAGAMAKIAGGQANPFTGLGTGSDRTSHSVPTRGRGLTREEIGSLYYGDAFIQKAVELVCKEAYRNWVAFDFADDTKLNPQDILQYLWRLKFGKGKIAAREAFLQASILARKDGDAFILVGVVDNADIEKEVGANIESIAWLRVMSRYEVFPEPLWLSMQDEEYSASEIAQDPAMPEHYRIGRTGQKVHRSRVLRFSGNLCRDRQELIGNGYYHHSVIQSMYKAYSRWEEGLSYGAAILGDVETYTMGIKGMGELLKGDLANNSTKGQERLMQRGHSLSMTRSVLKTLLYDLDGELPGSVSRTYAGAEGSLDRLERAWAASSGTPRWKLFEESGSAGLASSVGSAQILRFVWADIASCWAFENWKEQFDQLCWLVFSAKDSPTGGAIPENWNEDSAKFPNNITLSKHEQMELEKLAAERSQILTGIGSIAPEEIRRGYEGSEFSGNIPLLPDVDKRMEEQQAIASEEKEIGLEGQKLAVKRQAKEVAAAPAAKKDTEDVIAHFNAGLLSRSDALTKLGYENASELDANLNKELTLDDLPATLQPHLGHGNVSVTVEELKSLIELRGDDEGLWERAIASCWGEEFSTLIDARLACGDETLWLEAIANVCN